MPNLRRTTTIRAPIVVDPTQQFEGDDGAWSTFTVLIGTPPQEFRVLISTASSETWVVSPEGCTSSDPTNCPSDRGAQVFNGETSLGFEPNSSSTWTEAGLYSLDLETDLGYSGNGLYGEDVVGVSGGNTSGSGGVALGGQVVAGIAAKDYFFGMLGLSDRPTSFSSSGKPSNSFIANLFYDKLIPSFSYGYTAGAQYGKFLSVHRHRSHPLLIIYKQRAKAYMEILSSADMISLASSPLPFHSPLQLQTPNHCKSASSQSPAQTRCSASTPSPRLAATSHSSTLLCRKFGFRRRSPTTLLLLSA